MKNKKQRRNLCFLRPILIGLTLGVILTLGAIPAPCNELQLLSSQVQQLAGQIRHQTEQARLNAAGHGIDRVHLSRPWSGCDARSTGSSGA